VPANLQSEIAKSKTASVPMSLSIRTATIDDAIMIANISQQTFYETFAKDNTEENMEKFLNEQFTKGKLVLEVGSPENTFLIAYNEKEVAGYVKLRDSKPPVQLKEYKALEIARIYSMTHFIGKGVGKLLMESSIDFAKQRKKQIIWLGVWQRNLRAIDFYSKWGFEIFDETDFILGNDIQKDWLMKKAVD
jgi:ribosomal protein S18 acetylase RimI-like enzyme